MNQFISFTMGSRMQENTSNSSSRDQVASEGAGHQSFALTLLGSFALMMGLVFWHISPSPLDESQAMGSASTAALMSRQENRSPASVVESTMPADGARQLSPATERLTPAEKTKALAESNGAPTAATLVSKPALDSQK